MDKLLLYNLAKLYYIDGLSQQEISKRMGISRPQISRLLKESRARHIVEITLNAPYGVSWQAQADKLRDRFGLKKVSILNTGDYAESASADRLRIVTDFAAEELAGRFPACRKVGVGWGFTVYSTVRAMTGGAEALRTVFVPLVGNAGFSDPHYQTNSIVDRIAEKCRASSLFINTPAFVPTETLRQYMFELNGLGGSGGIWDNLDLAFFSLGGAPAMRSVAREIPDAHIVERLADSPAVGDVLGTFFDREGRPVLECENLWCVAIPLEKLLHVPQRVCIAVGSEKAAAIATAARSGFFTELITDHYTAQEIFAQADRK